MPRITSLASQAGARQPAVFFAHARLTAFRPMDCVVDALRWWPKLLLSLTLLFGLGASAAQGQTFLERLEEAVRSQLNAGEKPSSDEGQTISKENERQAAGRSDQQPPPAVAELPPPQSSLPVPEPPALPSTGPASGKIYVGLEVVETPGGGIGVRVEEVAAGGPADRGGIRPGDRILAVNGFAIAGIDDLATQLEKTRPGDQIRLLVNRDGRSQEFTVRVIDAALAERELATMSDDEDAPAWLGVVVTDLTESFRQRFGLAVFRGAAVTNVEPNSPAKQADLRPGDAIVELNGTPIESAADLVNWLSGAKSGQPVELLFYRGRSPRRVELQLGRVRKRSGTMSEKPLPSGLPPASAPLQRSDIASALPPMPAGGEKHSERATLAELARLRAENDSLRQQLTEIRMQLERTRGQLDALLNALESTGGR